MYKNVKKSCCNDTILLYYMSSNIVTTIVRLNGLYDILCGACLLNIIQIPVLNRLHADMFHPALATNDFASRLLGYWIITYGTMRLCHDTHSPLVSLSYYLEAICLWNEMMNKKAMDAEQLFDFYCNEQMKRKGLFIKK